MIKAIFHFNIEKIKRGERIEINSPFEGSHGLISRDSEKCNALKFLALIIFKWFGHCFTSYVQDKNENKSTKLYIFYVLTSPNLKCKAKDLMCYLLERQCCVARLLSVELGLFFSS